MHQIKIPDKNGNKKDKKDLLKGLINQSFFITKVLSYFRFEELMRLKYINKSYHRLIEFTWKQKISEYPLRYINQNIHIKNLMTFICKYREEHNLKEIEYNNFL